MMEEFEDFIEIIEIAPPEPLSFTNVDQNEFQEILSLKDGTIIAEKILSITQERNGTLAFLNAILGNNFAQEIAQGILSGSEEFLHGEAIDLTQGLLVGDLVLDLFESDEKSDQEILQDLPMLIKRIRLIVKLRDMPIGDVAEAIRGIISMAGSGDVSVIDFDSNNVPPEIMEAAKSLKEFIKK